MEASQDFKSLQDKIQAALVSTTRRVNAIASQDLGFRRNVDPDSAEQLDEQRTKILELASALVQTAASSAGGARAKAKAKPITLEDAEDVDDNWQTIVDALDTALEKADTCIDDYTGLVKRKDAPTAEMGPNAKKSKPGQLDRSLRYANIIKPQKAFDTAPDNFGKGPWKPILSTKPHATVPLEQSLSTFQDDDGETQYKHPYETEILHMKYPESTYQTREPIPYTPVTKSKPIYVDTYEGVLEMLEDLKRATEIAVDLEHHDFRTYSGLLSLMQVSTRDKDWVVDTLKPWRRRLEVLNQVFADPKILKVFHGAFMDIIWLQRDLGLYVVGLFDTFHAAEALLYPSKSLAYLLKKFADFEADKRFQMADWRIRPLSKEMLYYARSDTHYLLYVYDMMRNELVKQSRRGDPDGDLVEKALQKSKETSLQRHEPYTSDPVTGKGTRGWFNGISRIPSNFTSEQFAVFRELHRWRDETARREDESPMYIMSQQVLVEASRAMPSSPNELRKLFFHPSNPLKDGVNQLVRLIKRAREKGAEGPTLMDVLKADRVDNIIGGLNLGAVSRANANPAQADDRDIPEASALRGKRSQLWGSVPLSTLWEKVADKMATTDEPIAVPWSTFVAKAQVSTDGELGPADQQTDEGNMEVDEDSGGVSVVEKSEETPNIPMDQEFTLRAGRPPATAGEAADSSDTSDSSSDEEDEGEEERRKAGKQRRKEERRLAKLKRKEERAIEKAAMKAEKKALKQAKKAAEAAAKLESGEAQDGEVSDEAADGGEQPFDYSKAQSVMKSKRAKDGGNGGAKVFDPYVAKTTAQGPKAARRMNHERAGKTATFKK
ncbi:exosome complex exonuclease Rrp [Gaeumannomyces tritici R3-111a-1]|uniref:Exosome complex exonuclease Rrp n=1 Tax=Gaeumannomyces tritici (strain R3-111a-1) TaxID=644352 RepID=J3NVQ7_GAET3|nr:exosome complex exonuclease Rrp [Gaeumannomyces tritici R3-111a-1]EJT75436.1 exosome complex exonuclease Rrp [Gaeumannomyces tritici R3-111a-1]